MTLLLLVQLLQFILEPGGRGKKQKEKGRSLKKVENILHLGRGAPAPKNPRSFFSKYFSMMNGGNKAHAIAFNLIEFPKKEIPKVARAFKP